MVTPRPVAASVPGVVGSPTTRPVRPPRLSVAELAEWLGTHVAVRVLGEGRTEVTGLCLGSARVQPGDLYVALPGSRAHGAAFAADAVAAGAVAVLTDPEGVALASVDVPVLEVDRPRRVLGELSAHLYGDPAGALRMIGVTGTQGKTTTTRLAEAALQASGTTAGVIGTVGTRVAGQDVATSLTTPEAPDLQALLAVMRERGVEACAMEVSSHALVMGRVDGLVFDVATFLNLGRDHLDFHADLEEYFAAKASLFTPERTRRALVNVDDEHGRRLAESVEVPVRTFSASGAAADWRAVDVETSARGSTFTVVGPGGERFAAGFPLPGGFNVANALAAVASCAEAGLDAGAVAGAMAQGPGVPGRLEPVDEGQAFTVVVDYAHKPDAVEAALATLRPLTSGRVLVVIGAGGDRDPGKRPVMGGIAAAHADVVVVTDDNPRSEDPAAVRAAVLSGVPDDARAEVLEVGDRRLAIREALRRARPGDIVLVAGKGHESGQEVGGVVHPFDDRTVVREELTAL
ncbi:UDP-N-acetylmuramoyl-L-alanyl-D-glutamate--2,6-diaminopimelate ligase [Nocardioides solisilvae]|uniref:UDP-N-acetylmuramoyl-L-alanyl-D-glutamate--2, 6-diaminopimelate ligase n=1 Tax=Nocardioides solisilvae TaxID=1542435 RepID=UPI000D74383A|nr:UDP-N-acetylmuramoyl-L-alanyl-D-glutamate--2,6-diaminopimelate ligase [Nocardioides solisilvae]